MSKQVEEKIIGNQYVDLAPLDNIKPDNEYFKVLDYAFGNNRIKNLAITGPYGSGKSSIINSYLSEHSSIKNASVRLSMAAFGDITTPDSENDEYEDRIENAILKQLLYKVESSKTPQSRYRKLHKINRKKEFGIIAVLVYVAFIIQAVFFTDGFLANMNRVSNAANKVGIDSSVAVYIITFAIMVPILVLALVWLYESWLSRVRIDGVSIDKKANATLQTYDPIESVFNKNLDEIVYFFEATKTKYVIIEDMDRLNTTSIFVHLRELNDILNTNKAICKLEKDRVLFIYAVRDDLFIEKDRTKFFDFIVPVIPVVNSANSREHLLLMRKELYGESNNEKIDDSYITDIAPFITDMRVINNIKNEFLIYRATLKDEQNLNLEDQEILSLVVYKNLYPKEFSDDLNGEGLLSKAFDCKQEFIKKITSSISEEIDSVESLIRSVEEDALKTTREIKLSMLDALTDGKGIANRIQFQSNIYTATQVLSENFDLDLLNSKNATVVYCPWNNSNTNNLSINNLYEKVSTYIKRCNNVREMADKDANEIKIGMDTKRASIQQLRALNMKEIIEKCGTDDVFANKLNNKFLEFMLRRGYIDEKYPNYISRFMGESITKDDMNFILAVKTMDALPFDYGITMKNEVINRLQEYEFGQKSVLNFDVVDALLSSNKNTYKVKIQNLMKMLSDESDESWIFIDSYKNIGNHFDRLMAWLTKTWPNMFDYICADATVSEKKKDEYFSAIIRNGKVADIVAMNENSSITNYFEDHSDCLARIEEVESSKLISIIEKTDTIFDDLEINGVEEKVLSYIFDNNRYVLNLKMIRNLVFFKQGKLDRALKKKPYSTLKKLGYKQVLNYVETNAETYVSNVILDGYHNDDIADVIELLNYTIDVPELGRAVIEHENIKIKELSLCCGDCVEDNAEGVKAIWDRILEEGKLAATWENVLTYWRTFGMTGILMDFLSNDMKILIIEENPEVDTEFVIDVVTSDMKRVPYKLFLARFDLRSVEIPFQKISKEHFSDYLKYSGIEYSIDNYNNILNTHPECLEQYFIDNEANCIEDIEEIIINAELLYKLLNSRKLSKETKLILVEKKAIGSCDSNVAELIVKTEYPVSKQTFLDIWDEIPESLQLEFLSQNIKKLKSSEIQACFSSNIECRDFVDRSRRHQATLKVTKSNLIICERLKEIGYIYNYKEDKALYKCMIHPMDMQ